MITAQTFLDIGTQLMAEEKCRVCKKPIGNRPFDTTRLPGKRRYVHCACNGNPPSVELAHEERQRRRERGL